MLDDFFNVALQRIDTLYGKDSVKAKMLRVRVNGIKGNTKFDAVRKEKLKLHPQQPITEVEMTLGAGGSYNGERWRRIFDFPNYVISTFGRVKTNFKTGVVRLITFHKQCNNYPIVVLHTNTGYVKQRTRHRLVAEAFLLTSTTTIKDVAPTLKLVVNHKDENKNNPHLDNLEWLTNRENVDYTNIKIKERADTLRVKENSAFIDAIIDAIYKREFGT